MFKHFDVSTIHDINIFVHRIHVSIYTVNLTLLSAKMYFWLLIKIFMPILIPVHQHVLRDLECGDRMAGARLA